MENCIRTCKECGRFVDDVKPNADGVTICPDCGETMGILHLTLTDSVHFSEAIKGKVIETSGRVKQEFKQRDDVSAQTGEPVQVSINVDRSNPNAKPKVTHKVVTVDKLTGHTETIHEHEK